VHAGTAAAADRVPQPECEASNADLLMHVEECCNWHKPELLVPLQLFMPNLATGSMVWALINDSSASLPHQ
jgi:hypothetical protein